MLSYKEIELLANAESKNKVKCECGHSMLIPLKKKMKICSHCGKMVFKDKQTEFLYRINAQLHKINKN